MGSSYCCFPVTPACGRWPLGPGPFFSTVSTGVPDFRRSVGKIRGWILHGRNGIAFLARLDFPGLAWNQTSILISIGRLKRNPATQSGKAEVAAQALSPKGPSDSAQVVGFNGFFVPHGIARDDT